MSKTAPTDAQANPRQSQKYQQFKAGATPNIEDAKKYKKALRFIYKNGKEENMLTDEAIEACRRQGISTEDILFKTV